MTSLSIRLLQAVFAFIFIVNSCLAYEAVATRVQVKASERIAAQAKADVFKVVTQDDNGFGGGTGFLLKTTKHQYLVTNRHVCEIMDPNNTEFLIVQEPTILRARLIKKSEKTDLCLIEPPRALRDRVGFQMADHEPVISEPVTVFGNPHLKFFHKLSAHYQGVVVQPKSLMNPDPNETIRIGCIDDEIVPGESGSPVLNLLGEVVGVVFAYDQNFTGLLIPLNDLREFVNEVEGEG